MLSAPTGSFQGAGSDCPTANPRGVVGQHDERPGWIRPEAGGLIRRVKPDLCVTFDANAANSEENGTSRSANPAYSFRSVLTVEPLDLLGIREQVPAGVTRSGPDRCAEHANENGHREHDMQVRLHETCLASIDLSSVSF